MQFLVFIKGTSISAYLKRLPYFLKDYREIKNQAKKSADFPRELSSTRIEYSR
jgi:hypothetical protein